MDFMLRNSSAGDHILKNELSFVLKAYNDAAPYTLCHAFARCSNQLGRHGLLKKKETKLIGTYRNRVCNLKNSELELKTRKGKKRFNKFKVAQSMLQIAAAFDNNEAGDYETNVLLKHLSRKGDKPDAINEQEDVDGMEEEANVNCYFEILLKNIFEQNPLTDEEYTQIENLGTDAKVAATVQVVKTIAEAVYFLDPMNLMGAIVTSMNATYNPQPLRISSAKTFFLPDTREDGAEVD